MPSSTSPAAGRLPLLARMHVGTKLLLLVLLPVCVILALTIVSAADDQRDANRLHDFRAATRMSFLAHDAVQALAAARLATAVRRVRPSSVTRADVASAQRRADAALQSAAGQAARQEQPIDVAGRLDAIRRSLRALRVETATRSLSARELTDRYGVIVDSLIAVVRGLDASRPARASGRAADAYVALLEATEAAERERVNLATALAATGAPNPPFPLRWVALEAAELDAFRQNATGRLAAELDAILFSPAGLRVRSIRARLEADVPRTVSRTSLGQWLAASGERLAALRRLEREAAAGLEAAASGDLSAAEASFRRNLAVSLAVVILVVAFALVLRRSITRPLGDLSEAARRLSRGELTSGVPYAGRDEIGDVAAAFRDLRVTAERFAQEIRAMNVAIEHNRLEHRADVRVFDGTWARLLGGVNATMEAVAGLQSRRRRAEREAEDIFDLSLDLLCIAGVDGYFKRVNPAFERTLGYSSEELLSRPLLEFVHPDDHERTRAALESQARGESLVHFENRYIHRDGSLRWIQWNSRPAPGERGLVYAAARDVTDSRRAREEQAALRRVATLVAEGHDPADVFGAVAAEVGRLLDADATRLLRYEQERTATIVAGYGASDPALNVGARVTLDRLPDLGAGAGVDAPIVVSGRAWGVIVAVFDRRDAVRIDTQARMAQFTELVATAVANAQSGAELTASRQRIVETADETRRRIERDLHDGAQQRLVQAIIALKMARGRVSGDEGPTAQLIAEGLAHTEEAIAEIRELARGIHPAILFERGLVRALEALARRSPIPVTLHGEVDEGLPERVEVTAYYVVSEALANVAKHADASSAHVTVDQGEGKLRLCIADDGSGGADPSRGSGLTGLKDRVETGGGTLTVDSPPGEGTRLTAELPLHAAQTAVSS
jgi:PAS domain S-box-containing protein